MFSSFSRFPSGLRYAAVAAVVLAALPLLTSPTAGARAAAPPPVQATPAKPPTLGDALARVPWRSEQGVLLTLSPLALLPAPPPRFSTDGGLPPENADKDAENSAPVTDAETAEMARVLQNAPSAGAGSSLRLAAVARVWQKSVFAFGGVTVVAPLTVTVLNARPGRADLFANLNRAALSQYLLATLTPAQWRLLASRDGIGRGDLRGEQADLFDKLIPNPFTYTRTTTHYRGRVNDPAQTQSLTDGERAGVRLRVKLQTSVSAPFAAKEQAGSFFPILFDGNRDGGMFGDHSKAAPFLDLVGDNQYRSFGDVYGVKLSEERPNRPKPADVDFAALSTAVSLAPPPPVSAGSASVLTVADLIPRLRQATGLDLYADARLAKRRVWTRGAAAAQAGEILQALCFAVGGTVRKVEAPGEKPVYIVTSDREGIAARISVLDDWQSDARARANRSYADYLAAVHKINPLSFLQFDDDEPVKLPPALLQRVARSGGTAGSGRRGTLTVPPRELTPAQQAFLSEQVIRSGASEGYAVNGDRYEISASLWLGIVIPGVGEITGSPLQSVSEIVPDLPAPNALPSPQETSLRARVPQADDAAAQAAAREIVDLAAKSRIKTVYLDDANPAALRAAVEQAKTYRDKAIAVWGVLRALEGPPGESDALADRNARGQTSAQYEEERAGRTPPPQPPNETLPRTRWRSPARPETGQAARHQAESMAKVPGLAGILVADALPPGYRGGTKNGVNGDEGNTDYRLAAGRDLGWTPEQRVLFLRRYSADPADIVPYFSLGPVQIPYFPDAGHEDGGLADAWSKWRGERGQAFLTQLRQSIETARPGLPVQVCGQVNENPLPRTPATVWVVDWPVGTGGNVRLYWNYVQMESPLADQARQGVTGGAPSAKVIKPRVFLCLPPQSAESPLLRAGPGWDGAVFDFSGLPPGPETTAQMRALLERLP